MMADLILVATAIGLAGLAYLVPMYLAIRYRRKLSKSEARETEWAGMFSDLKQSYEDLYQANLELEETIRKMTPDKRRSNGLDVSPPPF
jgi:hypothetical protein